MEALTVCIAITRATYIAAIANVLRYDAVWAENRTLYLTNTEQMRYMYRYSCGLLTLQWYRTKTILKSGQSSVIVL